MYNLNTKYYIKYLTVSFLTHSTIQVQENNFKVEF